MADQAITNTNSQPDNSLQSIIARKMQDPEFAAAWERAEHSANNNSYTESKGDDIH